jgi:hypothetical protein
MNLAFKHIASKMKNGMIYGFASGFFVGCFPNKLSVRFENTKYSSLPIPLLSGLIGSTGFLCSPLLLINYFYRGVYFDKWIDKYDIHIERHHQYDGDDNKYAFPSLVVVNIQRKPV